MRSSCSSMMPLLLLLMGFLSSAAGAGGMASYSSLPPDPGGMTVIDREFVWTRTGDMDVLLAVLYTRDGAEYVDISTGEIGEDDTEWTLLHTWPVEMDGEPLHLPPNTVMQSSGYFGIVDFSFVYDLRTYEGKANVYLRFRTADRSIEADWSD